MTKRFHIEMCGMYFYVLDIILEEEKNEKLFAPMQ